MAVLDLDLYIDRYCDYPGVTESGVIIWKTGTPAVPVDLSGYTAILKIRPTEASSTVLLTLTDGAGIALGGIAGTITITMTPTQTGSLPAGDFAYDMLLTSPGGVVYKFDRGQVHVTETVSRA